LRILYVLPESEITGGGGIATYHRHARRAMAEAGHETYLFTWRIRGAALKEKSAGPRARIVNVSKDLITKDFPGAPFNVALSFHLLPSLLKAITDFEPDVIESSDYMAPMYAFLVHRRAGLLDPKLVRPVILYNHGMIREVFRANADFPNRWEQQQLVAERATIRWADQVLVPSRAAMTKLEFQMGRVTNAVLLPEPYIVNRQQHIVDFRADRYVHMGRISFSKGIDHVAHFLNVISSDVPIEEIVMIGGLEETTFRTNNAENYFLERLTPLLRPKVILKGRVSFEVMRKTLNPDGLGGYSMSFSNQETFNYAFLEMLEAGLFPFTHIGTAMAEFFPPKRRRWLIPGDFNLSEVVHSVQEARRFSKEAIGEISAYAFEITSASRFLNNYERILTGVSITRKKNKHTYSPKDITVLMATRNPSEHIFESVGSVKEQTETASLLILDDGSDKEATSSILQKLDKTDGVSIIKSFANEGLCASRQKLIKACRTPLAIFLDDDDRLREDYIAKTLKVFNNNHIGADAVLTWRQNFGLSSELMINYNLEDYDSLITNDYRMTGLISVNALRSVGFVPSMRNGEADDWDFWLRFFQAGYRAVILPEPLFYYNHRQGSMSWPWSKGQTALTSELLAKNAFFMMKHQDLPEAFFLDLFSRVNYSQESVDGEREDFRALAQLRPVLGSLAYFLFRMSRSIRKRLN
jgi:glycosyltransferase involved in cell wall biosynthesis